MHFRIHTLGCKVNIYESEALTCFLEEKGWQLATSIDQVDVEIVNTCTVTSMSDNKSHKLIRRLARENPTAIIVAMGCSAQFNPDTISSIPGVDIVIGTSDRKKIFELVEALKGQKVVAANNYCLPNRSYCEYEELKLDHLSQHTRGFVKVQDGCNNFCSYCAIPYARGSIRSRDPQNIKNEVEHLVAQGVKEIILAGINTGTYGSDLTDGVCHSLSDLISYLLESIPGLYRLRLSSIELMEISDELLATLVKYQDRVAEHLHIPLQAGCDSVLKRMNRKYLTADYWQKMVKIRSIFPNIAITTDCLAGFVQESEEEFQETLDFIAKIQFAMVHVFPYSRRHGTKADDMPGHLKKEVINERAQKMLSLGKKLQLNYQKQFINSCHVVIAEQMKKDMWIGHTSNYIEVAFPRDEMVKCGDLVTIKITKVSQNGAQGLIVKEEK